MSAPNLEKSMGARDLELYRFSRTTPGSGWHTGTENGVVRDLKDTGTPMPYYASLNCRALRGVRLVKKTKASPLRGNWPWLFLISAVQKHATAHKGNTCHTLP